jgi:hypothetical protein
MQPQQTQYPSWPERPAEAPATAGSANSGQFMKERSRCREHLSKKPKALAARPRAGRSQPHRASLVSP